MGSISCSLNYLLVAFFTSTISFSDEGASLNVWHTSFTIIEIFAGF